MAQITLQNMHDLPGDWRTKALRVGNYFDNSIRYTFLGLLGSGGYGLAFLIRINHHIYQRLERFVLKCVLDGDEKAEENLEEEIKHLKASDGHQATYHILPPLTFCKTLRGAKHIVRILSDNTPDFGMGPTTFPGKSMVMEYLEHGSMRRLIDKLSTLAHPLPNRILWSIFLCCRSCQDN